MAEEGLPPGEDPAVRRRDRRGAQRRRRRRSVLRWAMRLVVLGAVFWAGLAVGRAVEEAPQPGGTQTLVRTLEPATIGPAAETVTVTVAGG